MEPIISAPYSSPGTVARRRISNYTYTSAFAVSAVGITANAAANSTISGFSLTQVPEPSSTAILATALSLGVIRRRR